MATGIRFRFGIATALMLFAAVSAATHAAKVSGYHTASNDSRPTGQSCRIHLDNGAYREAVAAANVSLTRAEGIEHRLTRFSTLLCRANAYRELSDTLKAEYDYREALRLAEKQFGPFEPELVEPLTQLGRMRMVEQDEDEAELLLLRAKDITHRNDGIFNVAQDALLMDLTSVYMSQGRKLKARREQNLKLRAAEETYGDTPELVKALHDFARWAAAAGDFPQVRQSLDRAIDIQERAFGPDHLSLVETLRLRAALYAHHPNLRNPRSGARALERVAEIYASQQNVDQVDLMKARTDVGDWYMRGEKRYKSKWHRLRQMHHGKALQYYRDAVQMAISEGIDERLINEFYGAPKLLRYEEGKSFFYGRDIDESLIPGGKIVFEFHVSARGTTQNIRVIEDTVGNPDVTAAVRFRIETAYFRPRFINGEPVAASGVQYQFEIDQTGRGLRVGKIRGPKFVNRAAMGY